MGDKTELLQLFESLPVEERAKLLKMLRNTVKNNKDDDCSPKDPEKIKINGFEVTTWDLGGRFDNINVRDFAHDEDD